MADYTLARHDNRLQVTLTGDLTAVVVPDLQAALREQAQTGVNELVFDLCHTTLLDSSGIGLLIAAHNSLARRQARFSVVNVSPDILQLLQSMRLVNRLNVTGRAAPEVTHA